MILLRTQPQVKVGDVDIEIDDQSGTSKYIRIGDLQVCWGLAGSNSSGGYRFNTFPANFIDTNYGLTMMACSINPRYQQGMGKQTNGFYSQSYRVDRTRSNQPATYVAIGRWR